MNPNNSSTSDQVIQPPDVLHVTLHDDGIHPNNEKLPLLVYQGVLNLPDRDPAAAFERVFGANGWSGSWRNGIYGYHHYHSTTHEVLGVYSGSAKVQLGGDQGITLEVTPGDVIIIPAGVAHKNLGASADFSVVGAYPGGQRWDMNYGRPGERPQADHNIQQVPLPAQDPVYGADGPLVEHWQES